MNAKVSAKILVKVCVNFSWQCPGTSSPTTADLTVSLYLCSSGSNARSEARVRDRDEGVAGRNGKRIVLPQQRGDWFALQRDQRFFSKKIELVARPIGRLQPQVGQGVHVVGGGSVSYAALVTPNTWRIHQAAAENNVQVEIIWEPNIPYSDINSTGEFLSPRLSNPFLTE